jgi:hypothetical protein
MGTQHGHRTQPAGIGGRPTDEDYPFLAEATVLLAEGSFTEATAAFSRLKAAARTAVAFLTVGHDWAIELTSVVCATYNAWVAER